MTSTSDGSQVDSQSKAFLDEYVKNPERWIGKRIAEDLPDPGDGALKGSVRNDIKAKVDAGVNMEDISGNGNDVDPINMEEETPSV